MSTIKVQNIQHTASSTNAIALASDGTCTANITNNLSNRNLIINGAMQVAARGASGSTADGYPSIDRFYTFSNGLDENPTMSQESLTSSDTPFSSGFRKYLRFKNGNQTSGAGASDQTFFRQGIEAQNVAQSGWNYTSSSSFLTLSFWIRASIAQTYYGFLKAPDGSNYLYPFSMALSANTWTKVTKSIAGNSNLAFDNDNGLGLEVGIYAYLGTTFTDNSVSLDTWAAYSSGTTRTPDHTTTWYTTNDSTIDMTGVQLEVGSVATDFEHRSFAQELFLCQRYYEVLVSGSGKTWGGAVVMYHDNETHHQCNWVEKRAAPSLEFTTGNNYYAFYGKSTNVTANRPTQMLYANTKAGGIQTTSSYLSGNLLQGGAAFSYSNNAAAYIAVSAEL